MTSLNKNQFRAIAYYEFLRGQSAAKTADSINEAFKEEVLSHSTVVRLFQRFKSGDISFENHPSSGRPPIQNDDALIDAVEKNPSATTRELAMKLGVSQSTITRQLHSLGYRKVMSSWIPPGSNSSSHLASRVSVCQSLLSRPNRKDLISQIVTGSEFSIFYVNHIGQKKWNSREEPPTKQSKQEVIVKKVSICCWWDSKGILYWEVIPSDAVITSLEYSSQLQKLANAIEEKRKRRTQTTLLHNNSSAHVAKNTREKIKSLGWDVLPFPSHSPDLSPSEYHLFPVLKAHLREKEFKDQEALETEISKFFDAQKPEFWSFGIESLVDRWKYVIDNDGDYFVD